MGNRFMSTFPSSNGPHPGKSETYNATWSSLPYNSPFDWVTSHGWISTMTGCDTYRHKVRANGAINQIPYATSRMVCPTVLKRAVDAGYVTAASGSPAFLSSYRLVDRDDPSKGEKSDYGILDYECVPTDTKVDNVEIPGGFIGYGKSILYPNDTISCNLHYRLGMRNYEPPALTRDDRTVAFGEKHIREGCASLIATHFDNNDHAGHTYGFGMNEDYMRTLIDTDKRMKIVLDAIKDAVNERDEEWLVLISSDHGGMGYAHSRSWQDDEVVPFIMGIYSKQSYGLKPFTESVHHYDISCTIMKWLGIEYDEKSLDCSVQGI
jgi:hypothetical protein